MEIFYKLVKYIDSEGFLDGFESDFVDFVVWVWLFLKSSL